MSINQDSLLITHVQPEAKLVPWLLHQGSLTEKLKHHTGQADLAVLAMGWRLPAWWDQFVLNIRYQPVYHREILMYSQAMPYWYARTIIPEQCYFLEPHFFNRLQHESLANLIFDEPKVKRVQFFHYPIGVNCIETYWLPETLSLNIHDVFWVRLAHFSFMQQASFFLCEILFTENIRQIK
ncbi:chorismate lyase [Legionella israelensis]|uniref:chorismate--pyruvate lyase family protein n=1 Tax=Legionella israelensis TaxID=454 RepID=UPI00117FD929|nr:chorismate lyase [Legionella israelensis]QDP72664.1 chorismate lyase [Legionella israelensis]